MPVLTINYTNDNDNQIWLKGTDLADFVWSPVVSGLPSGAIINSVTMSFTSGYFYSAPKQRSVYWGNTVGDRLWYASGSNGNGDSFSVSLTGRITGNGTYMFLFRKTANESSTRSNVYFTGISIAIDYTNPVSTFSLSSSSVTAGSSVIVSISRSDASYTHRVTFSFGSRSYTQSGVATSLTYAIPIAWLDQIPNAVSGTGEVKVETMNGSTSMGAITTSLTISAGSDIVPTAGTLTCQQVDGYWNLYLQGYSRCTATLDGYSGGEGASVSSVTIVGGGYSANANTLTTGPLISSGTVIFTATVKDTRGRSAVISRSISVTPYHGVSISKKNAFRCNVDGTINKINGKSIAVNTTYAYTKAGENQVDVRVMWREYGMGVWTEIADWDDTNGYQGVILPDEAAVDKRYEVRILVSDAVSQAEQIVIVPPCAVFMVWSKVRSAFGFGTYPEGEKQIALGDDWTFLARGRDLASNDHHRSDAIGNTKSLWDNSGLTTRFYTPGDMTNQPTSYGNVLTIANGTEVSQLWFQQSDGSLYHRQGNANGWSGLSSNAGDDANQWVRLVDENNLRDVIYPVGAIYISTSSTSPASLIGGTWSQISGRFLFACDSAHTAGSTGGEESVVLNATNLPSVTGQIEFHSSASATTVHKVSGCFSSGQTNSSKYRVGGTSTSGAESIGKVNFSNGGSGIAHNNMPPYLSVYVWKRIA